MLMRLAVTGYFLVGFIDAELPSTLRRSVDQYEEEGVVAAEILLDRGDVYAARLLLAERLRQGAAPIALHFTYQDVLALEPDQLPRLEAEYRNYLVESPGDPSRHILLAQVLARVHRRDSDTRWMGEAQSLLDSASGVPQLRPWTDLVRANMKRVQKDDATAERTLEDAWSLFPGHPEVGAALAAIYAKRGDLNELVPVVYSVATVAPSRAKKCLEHLFGATNRTMSSIGHASVAIQQILEQAAHAEPLRVPLLVSLYHLHRLGGNTAEAEQVACRIKELDPGWRYQPRPVSPHVQITPGDDMELVKRIEALASSPTTNRSQQLETLWSEVVGRPAVQRALGSALIKLYVDEHKARAVLDVRRRLLSVEPQNSVYRNEYVIAAGDAGEVSDAVLDIAERGLAMELDRTRADVGPAPYPDWMSDRSREVAYSLDALGWAKFRRGRLVDGRRDVMLASLLYQGNARIYVHLGHIESALGHHADATESFAHARALGISPGEPIEDYGPTFDQLVRQEYVWLDAEKLATTMRRGATAARSPASRILGSRVPDFSVETLTGRVSGASLRGKVLVIVFWASWCMPCRTEIEEVKQIGSSWSDADVTLLLLSIDSAEDWPERIAKVARERGFQGIVGLADGDVTRIFDVTGVPRSVVVDRSGTLVYDNVGYRAGAVRELANKVEDAMRSGQ